MALKIRTDLFDDTFTLTENIQEDSEITIQNEEQSKKRYLDKKVEPLPKTRRLSSEEEGMRFSNDMKDAVKTVCQICKNDFSFQNMRLHTKAAHNLGITEYKMQHGDLDKSMVEAVYHKCGICSDVFLLHGDGIAKHAKRHDISHKEYSKRFLRLVKDPLPSQSTKEGDKNVFKGITIEELMAKSEDLKKNRECKDATKGVEQCVNNEQTFTDISREHLPKDFNGTLLEYKSVDKKYNDIVNDGDPVSIFSQFKERMDRMEGEGRLTPATLQGLISVVKVARISETLKRITKRLQYLELLELSLHKWHKAQTSQLDADKTDKTFQEILKEIQEKKTGAKEVIVLKSRLFDL